MQTIRYKAAFEYFVFAIVPELLLQVSITISCLTLAFGIVATLLNDEKFITKLLATVYCLVSLIARFAVFTAMFVEVRVHSPLPDHLRLLPAHRHGRCSGVGRDFQ